MYKYVRSLRPTLQYWADSPGSNSALGHELPQCHLQEEDRDPANSHTDKVGNQERP